MNKKSNQKSSPTHCGTVALIGAPNAGKSTLLNRLVGAKISIVTPKAQTTRSRVTGVALNGVTQLVFLDVPGVFEAEQPFERAMVSAAWGSAAEADAVLFLFDARKKPTDETEAALQRIAQLKKPIFLALNKIDGVTGSKLKLLELAQWFTERAPWKEVFMISALTGDGTLELRDGLSAVMPQSPWFYPEDALTTVPMRLLASELTREQCFLKLQEELPYTLTVETERYEEKDGVSEIHQVIIVQNERQKMIVIGKGGAMLKDIGSAARREISKAAGSPCRVFLFVKVREDWKDKPEAYNYLGLEFRN